MKTTNRWTKIGAVAVCGLGLAGTTLWAGPQPRLLHFSGTLRTVDGSAETLTLMEARHAVVGIEWNHHTRFYAHHEPIISTDLKPGERVKVACEKHGETLLAKSVRVVAE